MPVVQKVRIFLFQRDLRLVDNTGLLAAAEHCREDGSCILPLFIFDDHQISNKNKWRSPSCQTFMIQSLLELNEDLMKLDSKLILLHGDPAEIFKSVVKAAGIDNIAGVYMHIDMTPFSKERRKNIRNVCEAAGIDYYELHDYLLLDEFIWTDKGETSPYKIFGPFYRATRRLKVREVAGGNREIKNIPLCSAAAGKNFFKEFMAAKVGRIVKSAEEFLPNSKEEEVNIKYISGGRAAGLAILSNLDDDHFNKYHSGRDDLTSALGGTHLSAYIKFGTISIREVFAAINSHIKNTAAREAMRRQLYWRDFFYNLLWSDPNSLSSSYNEAFEGVKWVTDAAEVRRRLTLWKEGRTGFPIVDAAMMEIKSTHYMHNRARLIVASFLTKDLLLYWRLGEKYFAKQLVDYDPAINNLNWQTVLGCGPFALKWFRIMNPWRQSAEHDSSAAYIKRWLPQLADIPAEHLHNWHEHWKEYDLKKIGYYRPILDHSRQKEEVIKRFKKALSKSGRGEDEY